MSNMSSPLTILGLGGAGCRIIRELNALPVVDENDNLIKSFPVQYTIFRILHFFSIYFLLYDDKTPKVC